MANYAVLAGNVVVNVIVADTLGDAELVTNSTCVEYTDENPAGIGYVFDVDTGTFTNPNIDPVIDPPVTTN